MLHAPDFLGYASGFEMARDHRELVEGALRLKKAGNELMRVVGGREIHPINVRVGGFYRAPTRAELAPVVEQLKARARVRARGRRWTASLPCPDFEEDFEFVALRDPDVYAIESGRLVSSTGLDIAPARVRRALRRGARRALDRAPLAPARRGARLPVRAARTLGAQPRQAVAARARGRRRGRASSRSAATRSAASSCAPSRSSTRSTRRCA